MDRFTADFFDGRSSGRHAVQVVVHAGTAVVRGEGVEREFPAAALRVLPRLGSTPHRIQLPDGGLLVTSEAIGPILQVPPATGFAHRLESRAGYVVVALAGLALAVFLGHRYAVPWVAREVAFAVSPQVEEQIAREGMETLDKHVFAPSKLDASRREELRRLFGQVAAAGGVAATVEFRGGGFLGANAFALPGGVVVMTDELVELLGDDDRIAAVLAHEVGHLEHRHGTRIFLQDSITGLAIAAVLGDVSSIAGLVATLPAVLTHTSYSRDFEREADTFAYGLLRKTGRSPRLLGEALAALEAYEPPQDCPVPLEDGGSEPSPRPEAGSRTERPRAADLGYLSTHPATDERIRAAREAAN